MKWRAEEFQGLFKIVIFLLKKMDSKRQINQYKYKIIFNMPNMPSFYAFNPNHSALQPITYNTNTSWFAPIVQLFVSFLSAASNNIRSIDYQVSTRPYSTHTHSVHNDQGREKISVGPFRQDCQAYLHRRQSFFLFHPRLYQSGNILNTEWTPGTRHFFPFKNAPRPSKIENFGNLTGVKDLTNSKS